MHLTTTISFIAFIFVSLVAGLPQYGGDGAGGGLGADGGYGRDGAGYGGGLDGGRGGIAGGGPGYGGAADGVGAGVATAHGAERLAGGAYLGAVDLASRILREISISTVRGLEAGH